MAAYHAQSGGVDALVSQVQLFFSCEKLANLDTTSKSDPQIIVLLRNTSKETYREIGRTEWIKDNLNPRFATAVKVEYKFEINQELMIVVMDVDEPHKEWHKQDHIGMIETTVGRIVGSRGSCLVADLTSTKNKHPGKISITAETVTGTKNETYTFRFSAAHVDKKDLLGKSDPYLIISKKAPGGEGWLKVHETEVKKKTLDPVWDAFSIEGAKLCAGDRNRPLRFEVYDWDSNSAPDFIGAGESTVAALIDGGEVPLINPKKSSKKNYQNSGVLKCAKVDVVVEHEFIDFLRGGLQLNLMVSVDFTGSNGDPSSAQSLHYFTPAQMNQYQTAISYVGGILSAYDYDARFPVYGFGAKFPNGTVSHCFPLNGNDSNPEVAGIQGILDVYAHALTNVKLSGPTNFAPTIQTASAIAGAIKPGTGYLVLMILTDGAITDIDDTIHQIVEASTTPMSIIIIGVGNAKFDTMDQLDSDQGMLRSRGKTASRDIVQFVPFNQFVSQGPDALAAEVLKELPPQVTKYFKSQRIVPGPPPAAYNPNMAPPM